MEQSFQVGVHELLGRRTDQFIHALDPAGWNAHVADLEARRPFRDVVLRGVAPNGVSRAIRVSGRSIFDPDGTFLGYRGVASDVSAERSAEERFLTAIESIDQAFLLYDEEDRLILCNRRAHEMTQGLTDLLRPGVAFDVLLRGAYERGVVVAEGGDVEGA